MTLYLGNIKGPPRSSSCTPSELFDATEDQLSIAIKKKEDKRANCYAVLIAILSGLIVLVTAAFIYEYIPNRPMMMRLEQMQDEVYKVQMLQKLLSSNQINFVWDLCNKTTLQCSPCLPGWREHAKRCFLVSKKSKKWQDARRECLSYKGDLAVIRNAEDQDFLAKMAWEAKKANRYFHSGWIGLGDMVKEGHYVWVNGDELKPDVQFWRPGEPNNAAPDAGQDCVSLVVPKSEVEPINMMNTWDDIVCVFSRHYICETDALILASDARSPVLNQRYVRT